MDKILEQLVSIPSVSGSQKPSQAVIDFCAGYLRTRGMHVTQFLENGFPSLVATTRDTKTPTVMLAGHIDVVPAPEHMFTLRLENGVYYGRGVWDMKNAIANYLHIVDELQDNLADYDFGIMITSDEEPYGSYGTGMLVAKGFMPKVAILPDAIEPWHLQTFAKGCWFAEITAPGVSAHGARPWEGDSASLRLVRVLDRVAKLFEHRQKRETATLNVGIIRCGEQVNQIPDVATATLDIRYVEPDDMAQIVSDITDICTAEGATVVTTREDDGPVHNDMQNPYMVAFADEMASMLGHQPKTTRQFGTSDARYFSKQNIPVILTSPLGGGYHSPDEWLDAADHERFKKLLQGYLEKVAKTTVKTPVKTLTTAS